MDIDASCLHDANTQDDGPKHDDGKYLLEISSPVKGKVSKSFANILQMGCGIKMMQGGAIMMECMSMMACHCMCMGSMSMSMKDCDSLMCQKGQKECGSQDCMRSMNKMMQKDCDSMMCQKGMKNCNSKDCMRSINKMMQKDCDSMMCQNGQKDCESMDCKRSMNRMRMMQGSDKGVMMNGGMMNGMSNGEMME